MPFISYAQNYEDVILWRALKHIEHGFYIDVGAMDPVMDSVTKAFYERGWRGINIEPVSTWYEKIVSDRPEDLNLNLVILDKPGEVNFYEIMNTGLSTVDQTLMEHYQEETDYPIMEFLIPAVTLDHVLQDHQRDIHFLKVDVEGSEQQVLQGIDLNKFRPWIILVEATKPNTQEQSYLNWEHLLSEQGYIFVYFDGLNRFYLAQERSDLISAFGTPPNIFDDFIRVNEHIKPGVLEIKQAERQILEESLCAKEIENQELEISLEAKNMEIFALKAELISVYHSRSFRITAPLRIILKFLRRIVDRINHLFNFVILWLLEKISRHSVFKSNILLLINNFPKIKQKLNNLVRHMEGEGLVSNISIDDFWDFSRREWQIYYDLRSKIETKNRKNES